MTYIERRQLIRGFDYWCALQEARLKIELRAWRFTVGMAAGVGM